MARFTTTRIRMALGPTEETTDAGVAAVRLHTCAIAQRREVTHG